MFIREKILTAHNTYSNNKFTSQDVLLTITEKLLIRACNNIRDLLLKIFF